MDEVVQAHRDKMHKLHEQSREDAESYGGDGRSIIVLDPPEHSRKRMLVNQRFTPRHVAPNEEHIRAIVAGWIIPNSKPPFSKTLTTAFTMARTAEAACTHRASASPNCVPTWEATFRSRIFASA